MKAPPEVIPVHVFDRSDHAALAGLLAERPAGEAWAVIVDGGIVAPEIPDGVEVLAIAGCACCTGQLVLQVTLARLIRRRAHARIVVLARGGEHLARTRAAMADARYAGRLHLAGI